MAQANLVGLDVLRAKVKRLYTPDPRVLMRVWEQIGVEDNRRGVIDGRDKDDQPAPQVRYRPKGAKPERWSAKHQRAFKHHKVFVGNFTETAYNNLSPAQYRRLSGERLDPRGPSSRALTNHYSLQGFDPASRRWRVIYGWANIVSAKGKPFLLAHFTGASVGKGLRVKLPRYDLRGIRRWGQDEMRAAADNWGHDWIREVWFT